MVPEIGDDMYRELLFQDYRVVYRVASGSVTILGVIHGSMQLERQRDRRGWT